MQGRIKLVIAAVVALGFVLWLRHYFSDEAAIARMFAAAADNVANERILGVAGNVARTYSDPYGQSYESFLGGVKTMFDRYDDLSLPHDLERVSVSGATAQVELSFRLKGSDGGDHRLLLGEALTPARATVEVRKVGSDWKIERVIEVDIPNAPPPG